MLDPCPRGWNAEAHLHGGATVARQVRLDVDDALDGANRLVPVLVFEVQQSDSLEHDRAIWRLLEIREKFPQRRRLIAAVDPLSGSLKNI